MVGRMVTSRGFSAVGRASPWNVRLKASWKSDTSSRCTLLDTNFCVDVIKGKSVLGMRRLRMHEPEEIFLCSVVKAELRYGARLSSRVAENVRLLEDFFVPFPSIPLMTPVQTTMVRFVPISDEPET